MCYPERRTGEAMKGVSNEEAANDQAAVVAVNEWRTG